MNKRHPEQRIQEEWMKWQRNGPLSYERYLDFMRWRSDYLQKNPID